MSQEARDKDRNAAIRVVESACAAGRIIEADRDMRIEQLKHAQTLDEIAMYLRDLRMPAEPTASYGPPSEYVSLDALTSRSSASRFVVPLAIVVMVVVTFIGGIVVFVGASLYDGADSVSVSESGSEVDVLSADGYQDLLAAVEEQTGATVAFMAVLYPTYASVELPVDGNSQRAKHWYWDGSELSDNDVKTTASGARYELGKVDPAVLVDLVEQVRGKVESPESWYAIVRAPDADRAVIWAYATGEYGESAYLGARRDGTVTYDSSDY